MSMSMMLHSIQFEYVVSSFHVVKMMVPISAVVVVVVLAVVHCVLVVELCCSQFEFRCVNYHRYHSHSHSHSRMNSNWNPIDYV